MFSRETQDKIGLHLCEQIKSAVGGCEVRDTFLASWNDLLEGNVPPESGLSDRYDGAAEVDDPITRDSFLTLYAMFISAMKQSPLVLVEAIDPDDDDNASTIEAWLENLKIERDIIKSLSDASYISLRDGACPVHVSWDQKTRKKREMIYMDKEENIIEEENLEPGVKYKKFNTVRDEIVDNGVICRPIDLIDFFTYPSNAISIEKSLGAGERIWFSEFDLLDGVQRYGFDQDIVNDLIHSGPTHNSAGETDYNERRDWHEGVEPDWAFNDGYWEAFQWYFRMPVIRSEDARSETVHYEGEYFMAVVCPKRNAILKITNDVDNPYVIFKFIDIPNRLVGPGVPKLLEAIQTEATANIQYTIDGMNFEMTPMMVVKSTSPLSKSNWEIFPGGKLITNDLDDVKPLQWNAGARDGMAIQGYLEQRAQSLIASTGFGVLSSKVRKNAEMEQMISAVSTKFEMYLQNFQRGVAMLMERVVQLYVENGVQDDDLKFLHDSKVMTVSRTALRKQYKFLANAQAADSNPAVRLQRMEQILQTVRSSPLYQKAIQGGDFTIEYHMMRRVLESMGERNVEAYIGKEPPIEPPQQPPQQQQQMAPPQQPPQQKQPRARKPKMEPAMNGMQHV